MKKRIASLVLCFALMCASCSGVSALSRMGQDFWNLDAGYTDALNSGDLNGIIYYATNEINMLQQYPLEGQILECIAARSERVALSFESLGDYPNAGYYFGLYASYARMLGWNDAVKISLAKQTQYAPSIELYKMTNQPQVNYGAKNEPAMGVYYGLPSDSAYRTNLYGESMVLLYQEYGDEYFDWINRVMSEAAEEGVAVEYALNVLREGNQLGEILDDSTFLPKLIDTLRQYPNVPIFLRFGAEMNIWSAYADPTQFVAAFKKVASAVKSSLPNVAMVWSPNMVSSWSIDMNDYYPGDEYVDWVGASLYLNRYFLGREWSDAEKFNEVVFFAGDNADPVLSMKEIVTKYGDRKPIMISESGASHYVRTMNSNQTQWAENRLRQIYTYLPMVYPQIKLIAHFDKVIGHETNDYSLGDNSVIANQYSSLVNTPLFIQNSNNQSECAYEKYNNTININKGEKISLYAYAHIYGEDTPKLDFYIDNQWYTSSNSTGYERTLDTSKLSEGTHVLSIVSTGIDKAYTINVVNSIALYLDGERLVTDVAPVIINDRTLVPLRVISEKLGGTVTWHDDTQSIDIDAAGRKIHMVIDSTDVSVDSRQSTIDAAPMILNDRTMVPIRWIAETMNLYVDWNDGEQAVYMTR